MDANKKILLPAQVYFDSIIYLYLLVLSIDEGEGVIMLDRDLFLRETEPEASPQSPLQLSVSYFSDLKKAQKRFQFEMANAMSLMAGDWAHQLSLDPVLFKEFNAYAKERYNLDLPIEFRGKRPNLTLVLNRQPK